MHTRTWNYTFCIFFCFFHSKKKYSETNKLLLITNLHNISLSHSPLYSFSKTQQATTFWGISSVLVSVHEYTRMEWWNYVMVVVCLRFSMFFVVVGWCHLKFFFDIIFYFILRLKHRAVDKSQKLFSYDLDRNFHFYCDDMTSSDSSGWIFLSLSFKSCRCCSMHIKQYSMNEC